MGKMESWRATLRNFNNDIQKKQEANKNCTAFYLNANINTVCYLEKNLMSAYGSEHRQGCHFVACVKWWEECYLKCYRQLRHLSGWCGSQHMLRIEAAGRSRRYMHLSISYMAVFLRQMAHKQTQNLCNTNNCSLISIVWYKYSFSKQA